MTNESSRVVSLSPWDVTKAYSAEFDNFSPDRQAEYRSMACIPGYLFAFLGDEGRIDDIAIYYIADTGQVGFREFCPLFSKEMPVEGNYSLMVQPQVILWRGISREMGEFILSLLKDGKLCLEATTSATHQGYLRLPRAKWPLTRQHTKLRHLGVVFNLPSMARPKYVLDPASISLTEAQQ